MPCLQHLHSWFTLCFFLSSSAHLDAYMQQTYERVHFCRTPQQHVALLVGALLPPAGSQSNCSAKPWHHWEWAHLLLREHINCSLSLWMCDDSGCHVLFVMFIKCVKNCNETEQNCVGDQWKDNKTHWNWELRAFQKLGLVGFLTPLVMLQRGFHYWKCHASGVTQKFFPSCWIYFK